jgi:hypothetical protein
MEMAGHVDCCIMEAVQATTGVDFDTEDATRERLRIPTRMKRGGIKKAEDTRYPAFLGALLDVSLRCIGRTEANGECVPGYYAHQLTEVIGRGAYDNEGYMNARFLDAENVGPYPASCRNAWTATREEAMKNLGLRDDPEHEGCEKMGIFAYPTRAKAKNREASDRKKGRGLETRNGDKGRETTTTTLDAHAKERRGGEDA